MNFDINELLKEKWDSYRENPKFILSEYYTEKEAIKGYHGRELLELLQNAVDEMGEVNNKFVCIELVGNILRFSNNGNEFTENGIISLLYPSSSPKRDKPNYIGNKGTGFRSVLNWSECTRIYSGDIFIEFSLQSADELLIDLLKDEKVRSYRDKNPDLNVAILAAPRIIKAPTKKEFNTIIELHIKNNMMDNVRNQMNELNTKTILFLKKLERLTIICDGNEKKYKKSSTKKDDASYNVVIETYENEAKKDSEAWIIAFNEGKIKTEGKDYSIAIAYKPDIMIVKPDVLYSFFRTEVTIPFPVLVNGTFDLDASRNHLNKTDINKFVLEKACRLLIDVAIKMCGNTVSYNPLKLLSMQTNFPPELSWSNIENFYLNAVMQSHVFPTVNKKYISFGENLKFYKSHISDYLSGEKFNDLLFFCDNEDVINFITKISKIKNTNLKYEYGFIVDVVNASLPKKTSKDRASLCIQFIHEYKEEIRSKSAPKFILDSLGNEVDSDKDIFLPPDASIGNFPQPPEFANLVYIQKELLSAFREVLEPNITSQKIAETLSLLNVNRYDLTEIIRSTISKLNKADDNNEKSIANCVEMIKWLWEISKTNILENVNLHSVNFKIPMVSRNGKIKTTDVLYYGSDYGNAVIENLLSNRDDLFIISPEVFGLHEDDISQFCEFLEKLGVAKFPRILKQAFYPSSQLQYKERLISDFEYPLKVQDYYFQNSEEVVESNFSQVFVDTIEHYEYFLNNSTTENILQWLYTDPKARELVTAKFETTANSYASLLKGRDYSERRIYGNKISCFMRFIFSTALWIEIDDERYSPIQCLLPGEIGKRLLPFLIEPNFEAYIKNKSKRSTEISEIKLLLEKIGAAESFGDVSTDALYGILLILPEPNIDPNGKISRLLYSSILDKKGSIPIDTNNDNYKEFMKNGKVYCKNTKRYELISNVHYMTGKNISDKVIKALNINLIDIPSRQNQENIEQYFSVKKLDLSSKILGEPKKHKLNDEFETDFNNYKGYAFCYRINNVGDSAKIKTLRAILCEEIITDYSQNELSLEEYAFIRGENNTVYIKAPVKIITKVPEDLQADLNFCASMAEIITSTVDIHEKTLFSNLRTLYGKDDAGRQKLIEQDLDNPDIIDTARAILGNTKSRYDLFISACENISGSNMLPQIIELSEKINFENINQISNIENILKIIDILSIDIPEFNNRSEFEIDLCPYYIDGFHKLIDEHRKSYKNKLFSSLINKNIEEQGGFIELYDEYNNYIYSPNNSKNYNVKEVFFNCWPFLSLQTEEDADAHWKRNRDKLGVGRNEAIINELLSDRRNDSFLYFGYLEILSTLYEKKIDEWKQQDELENKIKDASNLLLCPIEIITSTSAPEKDASIRIQTQGSGSRLAGMQREYNKHFWGAVAEEIVYKSFQEQDDYKDVNWVSENAKKKGINPSGIGGYGYDLTYKNKNDETIYVEIKSTVGDKICFIMTENELGVAEQKRDKYEIALVINIKDENKRKIIVLPNLFVYKNGENRFKNSKFKLFADNYSVTCE